MSVLARGAVCAAPFGLVPVECRGGAQAGAAEGGTGKLQRVVGQRDGFVLICPRALTCVGVWIVSDVNSLLCLTTAGREETGGR
jgi:hypothetical protein